MILEVQPMADRPPRLEGKVAIVTGAGSSGEGVGNGKAASILFAREGAKVLLADFEEDRARETLRIIQEEGGVASTIQGDMTTPPPSWIITTRPWLDTSSLRADTLGVRRPTARLILKFSQSMKRATSSPRLR